VAAAVVVEQCADRRALTHINTTRMSIQVAAVVAEGVAALALAQQVVREVQEHRLLTTAEPVHREA
jgi:hypothetical protein